MAQEKKKPGRPAGSKNKNTQAKNTQAKNNIKQATTGSKVKDEIWAIVIMAIGAFLIVAIQTSAAGAFGSILHDFFLGCFGRLAYVLPYYLLLYGILLFLNKTAHISGKSITLLFVIFLMLTLLNSVRYIDAETFKFTFANFTNVFDAGVTLKNGGFFGMTVGTLIVKAIGKSGLIILSVVIICISLLLVLNTPFSQFIDSVKMKKTKRREMAAQRIEEEDLQLQLETKRREKNEDFADAKRPKRVVPVIEAPLNSKAALSSTTYVPGKMTDGQVNIMKYMKDDELFAGNNDRDNLNYGLVQNEQISVGFGLGDSEIESENENNISDNLDLATEKIEKTTENSNDVAPKKESKLTNSEAKTAILTPDEIATSNTPLDKPYIFPPIDLLNKPKGRDLSGIDGNLKAKAIKLENTLQNFHVDARVIQVTQGPAVTRYEIQPAVGVKVSSIVRLSDDIALNLEAKSIRIEAPIPGKAAVGIEVENDRVNMVTLRELVDSKEFKNAKSRISFAVGKDISGNAIVGDLKSMPHLLIAGSTGSGKSVCINSIIISILYKSKPEEVKFVLVDPKVVELGNYNGIPHLLIPVVTEPSKAAAALNWAVVEMTDRYKKFAEEGVRDLESFNDSVKKKKENDRLLPQIVIVIDELADLMMAAPSQVEESICRLAQMARAAGMHLIVATQRPSVDVVTGVIKANIPSRIAFAVSSQVDSRTILDIGGAEKLVGKGDMLYNPLGLGKPIRVQGTFVSDDEVHKVLEHVKAQVGEAEYSNDVIHTIERTNSQTKEDDCDELLKEAIETVVHSGQASVSMLQRRFRIGYNRAARIIDMMESRGIIGPADGSRPRQVLLSEVELFEMQNETEDLGE